MLSFLVPCTFLLPVLAQVSPQSAASQLSLPTSTSLPFPTTTLSTNDTQQFIISNWGLSDGRILSGPDDLAFVKDPFPNDPIGGASSSSPVLEVTYPAGSYSHDTGGAQFYSLWNTSSPLESVLLTYEVAFDESFDWVKGGKLPGLRGGPAINDCDGGSQPNGTDCFSTRVMWRTKGAGEVYAYMLRPKNFCKNINLTCDDDYGISVQRGSFIFQSGRWNRITLFVQMNAPNQINGNLLLYYNDVLAIQQGNLQFRRSDRVNIGGFFLSTFFGGSDKSWATPTLTHTYYRHIQMWGNSAASTSTDQSSSARRLPNLTVVTLAFVILLYIF